MRRRHEILNKAVAAGIYQRQSPLKWQAFTNVRVPSNVPYMWLQSRCCLQVKTFEVCNILGGFVLRAICCVVHYGEHCSNIFVIPMVGYVFIHLFICLFVVLRLFPLLLWFSKWQLFGSFPTTFPSLFLMLHSPRRLPYEVSRQLAMHSYLQGQVSQRCRSKLSDSPPT